VSPLGISGAYEPPSVALDAAQLAGVNLYFWEPRYLTLGRFLRQRIARRPAHRQELVIVAGSFESDRFGIERDLARAKRRLGTDCIDVFLLFWARSAERLSPAVRGHLESLKQRGEIRAYGFSTHHRELAIEALSRDPWDVVMLRHSAAHPGAEERLLPLCAERGIGVLGFSALSYGRLLRPAPGDPAGERLPTAGECYRYTLEQPAVGACWSAPRRAAELDENLQLLAALGQPLDQETLALLRRHGEKVRAEDGRWNALLRRGHEGAPQVLAELALLELLEEQAADLPQEEQGERAVPVTHKEDAALPESRLSWSARSEKL
jgi:diketogulonate reductase-like aldo/keto reductase